MKKEIRQAKIEQLINQNIISTQEALLNALKENGIKATQATISRDIREMKIVKEQDGNGNIRYVIFKANNQTEEERLFQMISEIVTNITKVEFMNVVKTSARNANVLAAIIDDLAIKEVVGTLAGFDTLVLISASAQDAQNVYEMFMEHIDLDVL
ncbi:ArgR family transcriptional regulator [Ligilactobacillus sp. Marseille-Q7487]|uniref:arginine repressor n=1 Tax=Ligilactobacillus sp. Marseille-Q7487 TaxID=3022128 RepID=UPI0024A98AA1|nr:ArgR family transcriptional regulator [Ligilactobacillus sp. Marseille-Q7487]